MAKTVELARAKLNLCLHVTGRRDDGYHLLDSLVVFPAFGDRIIVAPSDQLTLEICGPFAGDLNAAQDNLVLQAARLAGRTAAITLEKNLPVASGIGGGSADAAAALRALGDPLPSQDDLLTLGADLPVCLAQKSCRMRGIGEVIEPVDLPEFWCVLANEGSPVPTGQVFAALDTSDMPPLLDIPAFSQGEGLFDWLGANTRNDLQPPAVAQFPQITQVGAAIAACDGCGFVRMSGSGGTWFGLFAKRHDAEQAASDLIHAHPDWWVVATAV